LTKPVAVNTGLALPRSLWFYLSNILHKVSSLNCN